MFYSVDELLLERIFKRFGQLASKLGQGRKKNATIKSLKIGSPRYLFTSTAPLVQGKEGEPNLLSRDGSYFSLRHVCSDALNKMDSPQLAVAWHPQFMLTLLKDESNNYAFIDSSARASSIAPTKHSPNRLLNVVSENEQSSYQSLTFANIGKSLGYIGAFLIGNKAMN